MTLYASNFLGGAVRSIQKVQITNSASTDNTYTIAAVDLGKSAVFVGTLAAGYSAGNFPSPGNAELSSSTTLVARQSMGSAIGSTQQVYVVDFGAMVRSVQRGRMASSGGSASLAAVNPAKCIVTIYSTAQGNGLATVTHTLSESQLSLSTSGLSALTNFSWQVIEFY